VAVAVAEPVAAAGLAADPAAAAGERLPFSP